MIPSNVITWLFTIHCLFGCFSTSITFASGITLAQVRAQPRALTIVHIRSCAKRRSHVKRWWDFYGIFILQMYFSGKSLTNLSFLLRQWLSEPRNYLTWHSGLIECFFFFSSFYLLIFFKFRMFLGQYCRKKFLNFSWILPARWEVYFLKLWCRDILHNSLKAPVRINYPIIFKSSSETSSHFASTLFGDRFWIIWKIETIVNDLRVQDLRFLRKYSNRLWTSSYTYDLWMRAG